MTDDEKKGWEPVKPSPSLSSQPGASTDSTSTASMSTSLSKEDKRREERRFVRAVTIRFFIVNNYKRASKVHFKEHYF